MVPHLEFSGTIEPTRLSAAYRLGLAVVAITMLLLPVIYVGLIALTAATVWWHLTGNTWILDGGGQLRGLLYAAPGVAGVILMFFMVKPILARPASRPDSVPVDADAEPVLFAVIEEVCRQVRAPRPRRVQVDCTVNAAAGFMPGRLSLFRNDLVLTIGLPLAAGLSARELAGVLAHEFGHFAQGGGMRLTAIVRGVNGWFGRVVYERDEWDEKLERWSKEASWQIGAVLVIARGAVWVSRRVLTGLMLCGHAISCFMLRQMEYDADSYEIKVAGSKAFARTAARLRELSVATHFGYSEVRDGLSLGRLPRNLPTFIVEQARHLPDGAVAQLGHSDDERTKVFDTHPCDADRVRAAEAAAAPGMLIGADVPATLLFRDFEALSAAATRHHYEHDLGLSVGSVTFVETDAAIRESQSRTEDFKALHTLIGDRCSAYRPLVIPVRDLEPLSERELFGRLEAARDAMTAVEIEVSGQYAEFNELERARHAAFAAQELLLGGFSEVDAAGFGLAAGTFDAAAAADANALVRQQALAPTLQPFEAAFGQRLACALLLLDRTGVMAQGWEMTLTISGLNALAGVVPDVRDLQRLDCAAAVLRHNVASSPSPDKTTARLTLVERQIADRLQRVRAALAPLSCPPEFVASPMTLAERCGMGSDGAFESAADVVDRVYRLYYVILARLAGLALVVESAPPATAAR